MGTRSPERVTHLMAILTDQQSRTERQAAAKELYRLAHASVRDRSKRKALREAGLFDSLATLLHDADPVVQSSAIAILGYLHDKRAVEPIMKVLLNRAESPDIREAAAYALGVLGDLRGADACINVLATESDATLCEGIAQGLALFGELILPVLATALEHHANANVRFWVIGAMASMDADRAEIMDSLIQALNDSSVDVRIAAARLLGEDKIRQALPALKRMKDDNVGAVRGSREAKRVAAEAIESIDTD